MSFAPTNFISPKAKIGSGVKVGFQTVIHDNVEIEDGVQIGSFCVIGEPTALAKGKKLFIGANSLIRSHCVLYEGSHILQGLKTGHHVVIRELCEIGKEVQIGSYSDIQGNLSIGNYTRTQSNVFIAQGSKVGNFVWLLPYAILTNDPHPPSETVHGVTVQDYATIGARACILPGVVIGERAFVGAGSFVNKDVANDRLVIGYPAKDIGPASKIKRRDGSEKAAYPWTEHFHRGYPAEAVESWKKNTRDKGTK